jgi:amphi-Trp domain-containing protein
MSSSNGDKKSVTYEGQIDLNKALDYLKSLQAALKKGTAYVQNGSGRFVTLEPESSVSLQVEAKSKKDKQSIKIELSWERAEDEVETASTLTISETEPELVGVIDEEED